MTPHTHTERVACCYRCELGFDEYLESLRDGTCDDCWETPDLCTCDGRERQAESETEPTGCYRALAWIRKSMGTAA